MMATSTKVCPGSGSHGTAVPGNVYPHCAFCGRSFGTQGRKAQARLGNAWKALPRHYVETMTDGTIRGYERSR